MKRWNREKGKNLKAEKVFDFSRPTLIVQVFSQTKIFDFQIRFIFDNRFIPQHLR
jgi:hypothetical protein